MQRSEYTVLQRHLPLRRFFAGSYLIAQIATLCGAGLGIYLLVAYYLWNSSIHRVDAEQQSSWARRPPYMQRYEQHDPFPLNFVPASAGRPLAPYIVAEHFAGRVAASHGGFARIYTQDGEALAEGGTLDIPPAPAKLLTALKRDMAAGHPHALGSRITLGGIDYQLVLVPLVEKGRDPWILQLAVDFTSADNLLEALGGFLLGVGVLALALSQLLGWWMSRQVAGPLECLVRTAADLASGNLTARTRLPAGTNEVFAVAAAFDDMAEKLQRVFTAQKRFVADASHELKTPLTAIGGMAEMLSDGVDEDDPRQRVLAVSTISREVERMDAVVSDLLMLSQSEQAPSRPLLPIDLAELVTEASQQKMALHPAHRFNVSCQSPAATRATREELTRVARNLIDNAVKYTSVGGSIDITCHCTAKEVVLVVADTGIGISATDLEHVFEPFYRSDRSRARTTGGSGLGLSIVKAITQRYGGSVAVESTLGAGTRFEVRLPACTDSIVVKASA